MASALVFLVDKPLKSKGPHSYFDATHINSKKKAFKTFEAGDIADIKGDIIVEVCTKDKVNWVPFLNAIGSKWKTQIVPLVNKDSKLLNTIQAIQGYPIHPASLDAFESLKDWYAVYLASLLKVKLK